MDATYQKTADLLKSKYDIDIATLEPDYRLSDGNSKLAKDGIWSFNLIPIVHCPMAGACKTYCYATVGQQAFRSGVLRRARAYIATLQADFVDRMVAEVERAVKRGLKAVRIHDSGDFYSAEYMQSWFEIARRLPHVRFYAYTKMVILVRRLTSITPANFRLIQSLGGIADSRIDRSYPHSRIFDSVEALRAAGYADASESDAPAAFGRNPKIGLIIHGVKSKRFDSSIMAA